MKNFFRILAINPGSTSTKIAVFEGDKELFSLSIRHPDDEIAGFSTMFEQKVYRQKQIIQAIEEKGISCSDLSSVVGRGGLLRPLESGTFLVNQKMVEDLSVARFGEHASNLGAIIAFEIANENHIPAYIVDPVVVDELEDIARLSGIPDIERQSHLHALNIKAVSRKAEDFFKKSHTALNFIIVHMGSGISIAAQKKGKIIDVNNANNEGPFSPERTGTLPAKQLVKLSYSGKYSEDEMLSLITKTGGLYAYLGTKSVSEIEKRIKNGDEKAKFILDGMIYQTAKEIGAMATVLEGKVDGILLTGGISFSQYVVEQIKSKVLFLAPVLIYPGERELEALALGALRVLMKKEEAKVYL